MRLKVGWMMTMTLTKSKSKKRKKRKEMLFCRIRYFRIFVN